MARAVYSTRFIGDAGADLGELTYEVPAGFTAVIRETRGLFGVGAGGEMDLYVINTGIHVGLWLSADGVTVSWVESSRTVVNEGEVIVAYGRGAIYCAVTVSGYLLSS